MRFTRTTTITKIERKIFRVGTVSRMTDAAETQAEAALPAPEDAPPDPGQPPAIGEADSVEDK